MSSDVPAEEGIEPGGVETVGRVPGGNARLTPCAIDRAGAMQTKSAAGRGAVRQKWSVTPTLPAIYFTSEAMSTVGAVSKSGV